MKLKLILGVVLAMLLAAAVGGYIALRPHGAALPPPGAQVGPAPASHECLLPGPAPVPPDGATSTASDMALGHDTIQGFVNQLEAYQACLNDKVDHPAPGVTEAQKTKWIEQGNAAVDQATSLRDAFAAQLQIFNARPAGKP